MRCKRFQFICFLLYFNAQCNANPDVKRLLVDLFKKGDYSNLVRPVMRDNLNVTVHFSVSLNEVEHLEEDSGLMGYRLMLRMWWNDYQLRWDPLEYGGVTKIYLPTKKIWTPDIGLYNAVESSIEKDVQVVVYNDGDILWVVPAHFKSTCTHEFRSDSWQCPLVFRSWAHTGHDLDIKPIQGNADMDTQELGASAHYFVVGTEGARVMKQFPCCEERFPVIEVLMRIRNKIGHPALIGRRSIRNI